MSTIVGSEQCGCGVCPLRKVPALRGLGEQAWRQLLSRRSARRYSKGNILFYEGNQPQGMHFLCRGRVKIVKSDFRRRSHIARVVEAPDLLGDRSFIAGQPYAGSGVVMEDSRVCFLSASQFERLFHGEPSFWRELSRRLARELGQAEDRERDLALKTSRARLAKHLLERMDVREGKSKGLVDFKESRQELAEFLGTSPEAVCRTLAEFRGKKWVAAEGRAVRVLDEERLRQVADL